MKINTKIGLYFLLLGLLHGCKENKKMRTFPMELFQEGDIIFRRGTGIRSIILLTVDQNDTYSHVGIVIKKERDWKVVHIIPSESKCGGEDIDQIKMEDIGTFWGKEEVIAGALMRLKEKNATIIRKVKEKAIELYIKKILYDHLYDKEDSTKMYCTELVDFIYKKAGIDLTEGKVTKINFPGFSGVYLLPKDIQKSSKLKLIYRF